MFPDLVSLGSQTYQTDDQVSLLPYSQLFAQLGANSAQCKPNRLWPNMLLIRCVYEVIVGGGDRNRTDE